MMAAVSDVLVARERARSDRSGLPPGWRTRAVRLRLTVLGLLLLGAIVLGRGIARPINGNTKEAWRETDVGGIARNYSREGMRLFYPQIDWRGDGPGYVESEFPLYPYLIAIGYRTIGFHEQIGRVISWLLTLGTLCFVLALTAHLLPPEMVLPGMTAAGVFFIVNPLTNRIAPAIQPEPLMLAAYVGAVYTYIRWLDDDRWLWYGLALVLTMLAVLAKLPALHLGVVFVLLTLWRRGWSAFVRPRLWILAVAAVAPSVVWYVRARRMWEVYGNSLGVSNDQHFIGLAAFASIHPFAHMLGIDISYAWISVGLLTVLVAMVLGPWLAAYSYGWLWYAGVILYYVVIVRTSGEDWAQYYHIVSVPPIALLFGGAVAVLWTRLRALDLRGRQWATGIAVAAVGPRVVAQRSWERAAVAAAVLAAAIAARRSTSGAPRPSTWIRVTAIGLLAGCVVTTVGMACLQTARESHPTLFVQKYDAARQFAPLLPPNVLIAVSSNNCMPREESASNKPWMLYWTDHHGFDLCSDSQTVTGLQHLAARGARYFIEERDVSARAPGFDAALRTHYRVMSEADAAVLFDLGAPADTTTHAH